MFDLGNNCPPGADADPSNDRPARRQYTLKGVEEDTIKLMRHAANKEGMKIGSWVSIRMKEAAERALYSESENLIYGKALASDAGSIIDSKDAEGLGRVIISLKSYIEDSDSRISRMEREIHELTSVQRSILSTLLREK